MIEEFAEVHFTTKSTKDTKKESLLKSLTDSNRSKSVCFGF
jgi:hypothetical protein